MDEIVITDEMVRRGCEVVHGNGGIPFNPRASRPHHYAPAVREILEVALGVREYQDGWEYSGTTTPQSGLDR